MERLLHGWSRIPLAATALALLAATAACGGGDDATTSPPPSSTPTATATVDPTPKATTTAVPSPTPTATATPPPTPAPTMAPTSTPSPGAKPCDLIVVDNRYRCRGTITPSPSPTPEPTPVPLPTPVPCEGIECIEPAPGAFEHKTWEPGQQIDWGDTRVPFDGVFFLDVETGQMEGYRLAAEIEGQRWSVWTDGHTPDGAWITGWAGTEWALLLRRDTGQSWRWPADSLHLAAVSSEHLLFEEREESWETWFGASTGRFTLTSHHMEPVANFQIAPAQGAFFSPDGRVVAIVSYDALYLVSAPTGHLLLRFEGLQREGWQKREVWASLWGQWYDSRGVRVEVSYWRPAPEGSVERYERDRPTHYLTWDGDLLPTPPEEACGGVPSPNGLYVAQQQGELLWQTPKERAAEAVPDTPWPSVVVVDAATCEPLFRVRSASASVWPRWTGSWLPNSDGFVIRVLDGFAIVTVGPRPEIVGLPAAPPSRDGGNGGSGPVPPPTGDERYVAYGLAGEGIAFPPTPNDFTYGPVGVYDSLEDRWILSHFPLAAYRDAGPWAKSHGSWSHGAYNYSPSWGKTDREVRFSSGNVHYSLGGWLFLPPKTETAPFDREVTLRVARTAGQCIDIFEELRPSTVVVGCIAQGARLFLSSPDDASQQQCRAVWNPFMYTCYPSARNEYEGEGTRWYVYVRTEDGLEGWVASDYLEHD